MSTAPVQPGGTVRALFDTTDDRRITGDVTAETVKPLRCGCWAVGTTRPGPGVGKYTCRRMELLIRGGGCTYPHDDGSADEPGGMTVPAPVVIRPGPE